MIKTEAFGRIELASSMIFILYLVGGINELNHLGLGSVIFSGWCAT